MKSINQTRTSKRGTDHRSLSNKRYTKTTNIDRTYNSRLDKSYKKTKEQLKYEELLQGYDSWMHQLLKYKSSHQATISAFSNARHFKKLASREASNGNYTMAIYYYILTLALLKTLAVSGTTELSEDYDTEIAWYPDVTNQIERHNKRSTRGFTRKHMKEIKKGSKKYTGGKRTRKKNT